MSSKQCAGDRPCKKAECSKHRTVLLGVPSPEVKRRWVGKVKGRMKGKQQKRETFR